MGEYREQIEQQFPALKAVAKAADETLQPILPPGIADWVISVTGQIADDVHTLAVPEFAAPMEPVMAAINATRGV